MTYTGSIRILRLMAACLTGFALVLALETWLQWSNPGATTAAIEATNRSTAIYFLLLFLVASL